MVSGQSVLVSKSAIKPILCANNTFACHCMLATIMYNKFTNHYIQLCVGLHLVMNLYLCNLEVEPTTTCLTCFNKKMVKYVSLTAL